MSMQAYFDKIVKGLAKKKIITFPDYVIMIQLWKIVFYESNKSEFVERFPELSLFYELSSPLDSEMICIFPYFCPYEESAREIREFLFSRCLLLYQEVWRSSVLLFL